MTTMKGINKEYQKYITHAGGTMEPQYTAQQQHLIPKNPDYIKGIGTATKSDLWQIFISMIKAN